MFPGKLYSLFVTFFEIFRSCVSELFNKAVSNDDAIINSDKLIMCAPSVPVQVHNAQTNNN